MSQVGILILVFEDAVAITEAALCRRDPFNLATLPVERLDIGAEVSQLNAIRTDVLHRRRTDRAGNERQILQPEPALCKV